MCQITILQFYSKNWREANCFDACIEILKVRILKSALLMMIYLDDRTQLYTHLDTRIISPKSQAKGSYF